MRRLFTLALFSILASTAHATSFDCNKTSMPAEKLICQSDDLGALDEKLTSMYQQAVRKASLVGDIDGQADYSNYTRDLLQSSQRDWLQSVRNACQDEQCLEDAYDKRMEFIQQWHEDAATNSKLDGTYNDYHVSDFSDGKHLKVKDCLVLKKVAPDQVQLFTVLVFGNGHQCHLEGRFARKGKAYVYMPDPKQPELRNCKARLLIKRHYISLAAPDSGCDQGCGARGTFIQNAAFLRTAKSSKICEGGLRGGM